MVPIPGVRLVCGYLYLELIGGDGEATTTEAAHSS